MSRWTLSDPSDVMNKITVMSPPTNKEKMQAFLGVVGFWRMHILNCSLDFKPCVSSDLEEEWFQIGPWAATSLWTNQVGDSSCCSPWARCKTCAFDCGWREWTYLEPLAESTRGVLRLTSRFLELSLQRIWSPLCSNWKGAFEVSEPLRRWLVLKYNFWHHGYLCWIGWAKGGSPL